MSLAATVVILSFGIIMLFISVKIIEDKTSSKIELQEIPNLLGNANEIVMDTRNATKQQLINFFNDTSNSINNSTELQGFQQLWENP